MFVNRVPRSRWPEGCWRVTAWHKDRHIHQLLAASRPVEATFRIRPGTSHLGTEVIRSLIDNAVSATDVYTATAFMEPLFDAYESFDATLSVFEELLGRVTEAEQRRISCCLGYLFATADNRRDPMGKATVEITADHEYFLKLKARADAVRQTVATIRA